MPRLRKEERLQALLQLAAGVSVNDVATQFRCHRNTITRLQRRYRATGDIIDRPRSGRPRATTPRDDRYVTLVHLRDRFKTAESTARECGVSNQTILNRLRSDRRPIRPRRPYVGSPISRINKRLRLRFARRHSRWTRALWGRVLFSDESRFNVSFADGRVRVFRRKNERFSETCVRERDPFGGGGLMVWGGIMGGRKTDLIVVRGNLNAQRYIDEILRPVVVPYLRQNHGILMHDNARPHTAAITRNFLNQNNIGVLAWPARSPDLNPIEHIWDLLGRKVRKNHVINNVRDLEHALQYEWRNINADVVMRYVRSMRSRMFTLIRHRGGHNRY